MEEEAELAAADLERRIHTVRGQSVLRSERAVRVNIAIMRAFVNLRGLLAHDSDLTRRILHLEEKYDRQFAAVFEAIGR